MDRETGQLDRKTTKTEPEPPQARVYQAPKNLLPPLPKPDPVTEDFSLEIVEPPRFAAVKTKEEEEKDKLKMLEETERRYC